MKRIYSGKMCSSYNLNISFLLLFFFNNNKLFPFVLFLNSCVFSFFFATRNKCFFFGCVSFLLFKPRKILNRKLRKISSQFYSSNVFFFVCFVFHFKSKNCRVHMRDTPEMKMKNEYDKLSENEKYPEK